MNYKDAMINYDGTLISREDYELECRAWSGDEDAIREYQAKRLKKREEEKAHERNTEQ